MSKATGKASVVRTPRGVKDPVLPTVEAVEAVAAKVLAEFGNPGDAAKAGIAASTVAGKSEAALRAWLPVAIDARLAKVSARAFATMSGGNANTLQRLNALDAILRAGRKGKVPVPFWLAVAESNRSATASGNVVAALTRGEDVFGQVKVRADGSVARKAGTPKTDAAKAAAKVKSVNPVEALGIILANIGRMTDPKALSAIAKAAADIEAAAHARTAALAKGKAA